MLYVSVEVKVNNDFIEFKLYLAFKNVKTTGSQKSLKRNIQQETQRGTPCYLNI